LVFSLCAFLLDGRRVVRQGGGFGEAFLWRRVMLVPPRRNQRVDPPRFAGFDILGAIKTRVGQEFIRLAFRAVLAPSRSCSDAFNVFLIGKTKFFQQSVNDGHTAMLIEFVTNRFQCYSRLLLEKQDYRLLFLFVENPGAASAFSRNLTLPFFLCLYPVMNGLVVHAIDIGQLVLGKSPRLVGGHGLIPDFFACCLHGGDILNILLDGFNGKIL
jgi:hypothetical protein